MKLMQQSSAYLEIKSRRRCLATPVASSSQKTRNRVCWWCCSNLVRWPRALRSCSARTLLACCPRRRVACATATPLATHSTRRAPFACHAKTRRRPLSTPWFAAALVAHVRVPSVRLSDFHRARRFANTTILEMRKDPGDEGFDWTNVCQFKHLEAIRMPKVPCSDLAFVRQLPCRQELRVPDADAIADFSPLQSLPQLR